MTQQVSWIDLELSAVFMNERDSALERAAIDRIVAERKAARIAADAAKARAWKVIRHRRMAIASTYI